ncbi:hypothetical protein DVV91_09970 [Clostridium botulinum]|uniref:hypothetical protein n=1 Tax=Clostridium botulinum TaxID=1491 RepID=UPI001967407C|nr:hypothetical protein [Clostridium botulinum]MBN1074667.1 hypothetical protein [Clostridium botulinum]
MKKVKRITESIFFNKESEKEIIFQIIERLISQVPSGGDYQITVGKIVEFHGDINGCEITVDYFENKE